MYKYTLEFFDLYPELCVIKVDNNVSEHYGKGRTAIGGSSSIGIYSL